MQSRAPSRGQQFLWRGQHRPALQWAQPRAQVEQASEQAKRRCHHRGDAPRAAPKHDVLVGVVEQQVERKVTEDNHRRHDHGKSVLRHFVAAHSRAVHARRQIALQCDAGEQQAVWTALGIRITAPQPTIQHLQRLRHHRREYRKGNELACAHLPLQKAEMVHEQSAEGQFGGVPKRQRRQQRSQRKRER
eukprot:ctg_1127.g226